MNIGQLFTTANGVAAASCSFATDEQLEPIRRMLQQARESLGMDVAFVARIEGSRRMFEIVDLRPDNTTNVTPGAGDELIDTYCKLVVDGRLPPAVPDTQADLSLAAMPITAKLRIRSYLSAPIRLSDGTVYGTVCCFSHEPLAQLRAEQAAVLRTIADAIAKLVEERRPG